jgi:hypothetical protein
MARFLSANPDMFPHVRWVFVPLVNPDGATHWRYNNCNVPSVQLNSNFNADWTHGGTGDSVESEPETRSLARAIDSIYFPDLYIDWHSNANRIWVVSQFVTYALNVNPYLIANGFAPQPIWPEWGGGIGCAFRWTSDTLGIKSYLYEIGQSDTTEEVNRGIAALISFADRLQHTPTITAITVAAGSRVTVNWTEDVEPDSVRVIRDGTRIDVVAGGAETYVDTVSLGTYRYTLLGFFDGGQPSDSSNSYDVTVSVPNFEGGAWRGSSERMFRLAFRRLFR